jgi:hypothetical protein
VIQVSSYALARSRKIADVGWFWLNPLLMAASNWMRLSEVVHPRRNPVWILGRNVCLSKYHFILLLIIFFRIMFRIHFGSFIFILDILRKMFL